VDGGIYNGVDTSIDRACTYSDYDCTQFGNVHKMISWTACQDWCKSWTLPGCCEFTPAPDDSMGQCDFVWTMNFAGLRAEPGRRAIVLNMECVDTPNQYDCNENAPGSRRRFQVFPPATTTATMATTITTTSSVHSDVGVLILRIVKGPGGSNECPQGSYPLDDMECEEVALRYGRVTQLNRINELWDPQGCFESFDSVFYFNTANQHRGRDGRSPVCKIAHDGAIHV